MTPTRLRNGHVGKSQEPLNQAETLFWRCATCEDSIIGRNPNERPDTDPWQANYLVLAKQLIEPRADAWVLRRGVIESVD